MKSLACLSYSVRAACQHTSACSFSNQLLLRRASPGRCAAVPTSAVIAQQPGVTALRPYVTAAATASSLPLPLPAPVALPLTGDNAQRVGRRSAPPSPHLSPYRPHLHAQGSLASPVVSMQSLFEGDVISQLCSRLAGSSSNDRAEGLVTLLGACLDFGLGPQSPAVRRLTVECLQLLSGRDVGVAQLCHLGEVAHAIGGGGSEVVAEVLRCLGAAVEEGTMTPSEAVAVYSLMALCLDPGSQQQMLTLSNLHRHTQRLVHRLRPSQVCAVLQLLSKLPQRQNISLVLRLCQSASYIFPQFTDDEVTKVLSAMMVLGQHHTNLLDAMEKHLPGRLKTCDPELIGTVMEYCMQMRCRSETIFEAVAENFVLNAETHTTPQIAKQTVAMGRLNYLPQCSSQMFKKLESILATRFSQFQPRSLIEVLHSCIHLERFPINYMDKIFSPYFLQRLQAQAEPLDKKALAQLTQLHLSTSLECTHYQGPRLPPSLHVKSFFSADEAFETHMDVLMFKQVTRLLTHLLGRRRLFLTKVISSCGYTIDVALCLDDEGYVLDPSQWEHAHTRVALYLDGKNRFCRDTHYLLGKEATKRRHLRRMGYKVVQIPYFEFEKLPSKKAQVKYLHDKIFPTTFKFNH